VIGRQAAESARGLGSSSAHKVAGSGRRPRPHGARYAAEHISGRMGVSRVARVEGCSVSLGEREALAFEEGDDEDAGLGGYDRRLGQGLGGSCANPMLAVGDQKKGLGELFLPMAFSSVGVADPARPPGLLSLSVMVEVEGEREKVLVRGPRWVSFNSAHHHMSAGIPSQKGARCKA